jgi:hypothetical protein
MLKLPTNPSDKQLNAIALATIRQVFEEDAELTSGITPFGDSGWQTTYKSGNLEFKIEWDGIAFTKYPKNINQFAALGDIANFAQAVEGDPIDDLLKSFSPEQLQRFSEDAVKPYLDLIDGAGDFNEALEGLANAYPNSSTEDLIQTLQKAFFVSEVWGRLQNE